MKQRRRARELKRYLSTLVRVELRLDGGVAAFLGTHGDPEGFIKRAMRWAVDHPRVMKEVVTNAKYTTENTMTAKVDGAN